MDKKIALVTGGAVGIGRAISLELAKEGYTVIVNYRSSDKEAISLVEEIKSLGSEGLAIKCDISDFSDTKLLIDKIIDTYGKLNILVNNAGITDDTLLLRMKEEQFSNVIDVNLKGVFNVTKHALRPILKSGYGRIINISSVSAIKGNVGQTNYSAAKAGVIGFSKSLAKEVASKNVTVNVIAPGFIETKMTEVLSDNIKEQVLKEIPLNSFGQVDDIAHAVAFLASPKASYITGVTINVDGGLSI